MKAKLEDGYLQWICPAQDCGDHQVPVGPVAVTGGCWGFNGNTEAPTLTPSVRISWEGLVDDRQVRRCCHFHVVDGVVNFCGDCTHELAGKNVPLKDYE
jgi:hypothetical protein